MNNEQPIIRKSRGFTLIELLVVVGIIALIAVIVLFNTANIRARSRDVRRITDIKSIQEALAMYYSNNQFYPYPYPAPGQEIDGTDPISMTLISDQVINMVPADPLNDPPYEYFYTSGDGKSYVLKYYLETSSIQGLNQGENTVSP